MSSIFIYSRCSGQATSTSHGLVQPSCCEASVRNHCTTMPPRQLSPIIFSILGVQHVFTPPTLHSPWGGGPALSPGYLTQIKRGSKQNSSVSLKIAFGTTPQRLGKVFGRACSLGAAKTTPTPPRALRPPLRPRLTLCHPAPGSCGDGWWWMMVGQRACFLDVPSTSVSRSQISSEDERGTHTFTYMTTF